MKTMYTDDELVDMFTSFVKKASNPDEDIEHQSPSEALGYIQLKDNTENSTKLFKPEAFFQKLYDDNAKVDTEIKKIYDMLNKLSDDILPVIDELKNELPHIKKLFGRCNSVSDKIEELKNTIDAHELQIMEVKKNKQKTFSEVLKEKAEITTNLWSITKVIAVVFMVIMVVSASAPNLMKFFKLFVGGD